MRLQLHPCYDVVTLSHHPVGGTGCTLFALVVGRHNGSTLLACLTSKCCGIGKGSDSGKSSGLTIKGSGHSCGSCWSQACFQLPPGKGSDIGKGRSSSSVLCKSDDMLSVTHWHGGACPWPLGQSCPRL